MESGQYLRVLAEFVIGDMGLPSLKQFVEERLLELRQSPRMTKEKEILSATELYLHEAEEGLRDTSEVYFHIQSILDTVIIQKLTSEDINPSTALTLGPPNMPYFLSRTFDVDTKHADTQQKELPVPVSK